MPSGKGRRLIVEGWIDGGALVFRSKDYHNKMNSEHYIECFTEQLLPNIPQQSVIILDNTTYHNKEKDKPPTTARRKDDIRKWLDQHNIPYDNNDIKKTLLHKVRQYKPRPTYLTDKATQQHGHTVLRLPVAHCELNPIEVIQFGQACLIHSNGCHVAIFSGKRAC